jgi:hypothetical protein
MNREDVANVYDDEQFGYSPEKGECSYCLDGNPAVRETLPDGEIIWAHWSGGVLHQCKTDR